VQSTWAPLAILGILAGAYIAFGAQLSTVVTSDLSRFFGDGFSRLVAGLVFSVGLILVVIGGGELFTGNSLMVSGVLSRKFGVRRLLWHWGIVYVANFAGAILVVAMMAASGLWSSGAAATGVRAINVAASKVSLGWGEAMVRGILCNWLVCLAVWLALAARDGISKLMACVFPVTAFVASGFEHSIANMYFVPAGILAKGSPAVVAALTQTVGPAQATALMARLNWPQFITSNLVPVTIGNVIGGVVLVACAYWFAYAKPVEAPRSKRLRPAVSVPVQAMPRAAVGGE
jgi:formate/nitrite transporter